MCVCAAIEPIDLPGRCVIVQEAKERHHAKNTVRLLQLALPYLDVILSTDHGALSVLQTQVAAEPKAWGLVYPSANSQILDDPATSSGELPMQWILLDGTWKKTKRLLFEHPWLTHMPAFSFADPPPSQYFIRKVPSSKALSTLESVAYLYQLTQGLSMNALLKLQHRLVEQWQEHQPVAHQPPRQAE